MYTCPFAGRCDCPVKFRVVTNESEVFLYTHGKHTPESHQKDQIVRGLKLPQKAAVQSAVRVHPMASASDVRRSLNLVEKSRRDEVYISPSKKRAVQREVSRVRGEVLAEFSCGERIDRTQGSLTRMCDKMYIKKLVEEHNRPGGKHLELHQPICLGYQFEKGVTFANWSTPFLALNSARSMNSEWPVQMGFDSSGSISDTKFDLVGITTNSLRSRANPICLAIANKESADAYEHTYETMESGLFQLVGRIIRCDPPCELCAAIEEQVQQPVMRAELEPPKKKKGQPDPPRKKFSIPLAHPLCDNTTKFSKFIHKKKPHLKGKINQCAAHLTGKQHCINSFLHNALA
jgi:hypothetical protein